MHRYRPALLAAAITLSLGAMPATARAFDEVDFSVGHGIAASPWFRLALVSNLDDVDFLPSSEYFHFYWSLGLDAWHWKQGKNAAAISIVPMVRLGKPEAGLGSMYLEAGFGPHLLTNISGSGRNLSTAFEFGSHIGIGIKLSHRIGIIYRWRHLSNGGMAKPNGGVNVNLIGLTYHMD